MEVLGAVASGLTLVGLFKVCVEAFDVIQTARNQELDCRKLILRLNIEKCRLYAWGQAIGLTDAFRTEENSRPLQDFMFEGLVQEALEMILLLFGDANKLKDTYGCKQEQQPGRFLLDTEADSIDKLAIAFKRFRINGKLSKQASELYSKAKWSIYDRKKFGLFVAEAKTLVDGLQETTKSLSSLPQQKKLMTSAIQSIKDVRTHILIADVCEADYPELSEVSARATEAASLLPEDVQRIDEWKLEVGTSNDTEDLFEELESMTTTELKHRILQLTQGGSQKATTSIAVGKVSSGIEYLRHACRFDWDPRPYGWSSTSMKCRVEGCPVISNTPWDDKKHLARHKLEHACSESGCSRSTQGFATFHDLNLHMVLVHKQRRNTRRTYRCLVPSCNIPDQEWSMKADLTWHLIAEHPEEDIKDLTRQSDEAWYRRYQSKGPVFAVEEPKPPPTL
jgi:hypothetical protein